MIHQIRHNFPIIWYSIPLYTVQLGPVRRLSLLLYKLYVHILHVPYSMIESTINAERFAGLSFRVFHGFQEYHESFFANISASL